MKWPREKKVKWSCKNKKSRNRKLEKNRKLICSDTEKDLCSKFPEIFFKTFFFVWQHLFTRFKDFFIFREWNNLFLTRLYLLFFCLFVCLYMIFLYVCLSVSDFFGLFVCLSVSDFFGLFVCLTVSDFFVWAYKNTKILCFCGMNFENGIFNLIQSQSEYKRLLKKPFSNNNKRVKIERSQISHGNNVLANFRIWDCK